MSYKKAIIFSAPSGAGKTTIVKYLLEQISELSFSISACSRSPRENEKDGKDYYFLSVDEFKSRINQSRFLEWEEVYSNMFYGTLIEEVERLWAEGKVIIFDVDVKGALALKSHFKENGLAIFVAPPSIETLEERLRSRGTENEESLNKRVSKAASEMEYQNEFDVTVINDNLEDSCHKSLNLVKEFIG
jgi:guanylate kinase